MKKVILALAAILVVILLVFKATSYNIEGNWQAELVIENAIDTLDINLSEISLLINEDHYTFRSTLKKVENGSIIHSGKELILTNTENDSSYKLDILKLSKTNLHLQMYGGDQSRQIHFSKAE